MKKPDRLMPGLALKSCGRGERIRTSGLYVPNDVFVALASLKRVVPIVPHSIKINNLRHFSPTFGQIRSASLKRGIYAN